MRATENYSLFQLAFDLHKTVAELSLGQALPFSTMERYMWNRWKLARMRLEQQARK